LIVAIWLVSGILAVASYHGGTWHGKRIAKKIIDKERAEREKVIKNEGCAEEEDDTLKVKVIEKEKCLKEKKCSKGADCKKITK
jgi:hypothetical protein